jgi:hypothetical protein
LAINIAISATKPKIGSRVGNSFHSTALRKKKQREAELLFVDKPFGFGKGCYTNLWNEGGIIKKLIENKQVKVL